MFFPFVETESFRVFVHGGDALDRVEDDGDTVSAHVKSEDFAVFGAQTGDVGFLAEEEGDCDTEVGSPSFFKRRLVW